MDDIYFGYPACGLSIYYYLLQIIPFFDFSKKKFKYNNISPIKTFLDYVFTLYWYYFGDIMSYKPIKYCNYVGLLSFLFVICIYLYHKYKQNINVILDVLVVSSFTIAFYHYFTYVVSDPNTNGKYCVGISIIIYLFQFNLILNVIKDNNYLLISLYPTIISLIVSLLWYKFGDLNKDIYIKISFGVNAIIELIKIVIYVIYKKLNNYIINHGNIHTNKIKTIEINNNIDDEEEKQTIKNNQNI